MVSVTEGRYEMKYALPLDKRAEVVEFARPYISPDAHGQDLSAALPEVHAHPSEPPRGYRVSSLYLDDHRLTGYIRRLDGRRIRNRIRIRTYGDPGTTHPVFLEAKRKLHKKVIKHRVGVGSTDHWHTLPSPNPWDHVAPLADPLKQTRLERWCDAVREKQLAPVCRVEYWRETFAKGHLRLTLDHRVGAAPTADPLALRGPCPIRLIPHGWVVLELKYNGQPPRWMRRLVSRFGLVAEPISKFALGVALTCRAGRTADLRATTPPSIRRAARTNRAAK